MDEPILQDSLPPEQVAAAADPLPRLRPVAGPWLTVDRAYAAQVAEKRRLLSLDRQAVMVAPEAEAGRCLHAALVEALAAHPRFAVEGEAVRCPDGRVRRLRPESVLEDAAGIVQEDLCLVTRRGGEHVLTAALLCFPASWTLAEKIGRPLLAIHGPVAAYDAGIAARVDRLFDGVKPGRPLWRANLLRYAEPALRQPRREADPRRPGGPDAPFLRSERQTLVRLAPDLVLFAIHTSVVRA